MKCKHDLDGEVCLVCMQEAYQRAGKPLPENVLLDVSLVLQKVRDQRIAEIDSFVAKA